MAITKLSLYNSSPTVVADYQAQNGHLQAFINKYNGIPNILSQDNVVTVLPYIKQGTYISMGGTMYIVDTENYAIQGSVSTGDNYISLSVSVDNLIATWVQDISSYSWDSVYNYYSNGTNILLPYRINYDGTNYNCNMFNNLTQKLGTTDNPIFNTVNTGQGANELYPMNQPVRTTDSPTFAGLALNGALTPTSSPTSGTHTISSDDTWTPPRGSYMMTSNNVLSLSVDGGATFAGNFSGGVVFADGLKLIIKNDGTYDAILKWLLF